MMKTIKVFLMNHNMSFSWYKGFLLGLWYRLIHKKKSVAFTKNGFPPGNMPTHYTWRDKW